ncbi:MAG: amidohydrolase family protein, partial [Colwellia sp.]|nr:amidohydrolase family protein [Colwellia sp.]
MVFQCITLILLLNIVAAMSSKAASYTDYLPRDDHYDSSISTPESVLGSGTTDDPSVHYDILIKNGTVIDGSGKAGFIADIAVKNGKIMHIGKLNTASAERIINAKNMVVSPGFIDLHSHADHNLLRNPDMENGIRQGITTVLGGNCGGSPLPIDAYMSSDQEKGIS